MEAEDTLSLFDCYWFELQILKKQPYPSNSEANPDQKTRQFSIPSLPAISTRSMDELVSSSSCSSINSLSPSSVLLPRRLQTIFSGKEVKDTCSEEEEGEGKVGKPSRTGENAVETETPRSLPGGERRRSRGREQRKKKLRRGLSKSLSELEFEELKGFMDLGFVFSEEDKGSEFLATILPGLQRLGVEGEKEEEGNTRRSVNGSGISRPYLSEAWEVSQRNRMRKRRENHPLMMSWGDLPSVDSKIDMKDYLKSWAHSVASSVR